MPNSITKTESGQLLFENNTGKSVAGTYTGSMGVSSGIWTYRNIARAGDSGNIVVRSDSGGAGDLLTLSGTTKTPTFGAWVYWGNFSANAHLIFRATDGTTIRDIGAFNYGINWASFEPNYISVTTQLAQATGTAGVYPSQWYYQKVIFDYPLNTRAFLYNSNSDVLAERYTAYNNTTATFTNTNLYTTFSSTITHFDNLCVCKSNYLNFNGFTQSMRAELWNTGTTKIIDSLFFNGTSGSFDLGTLIFPYNSRLKVYGVDNSLVYETPTDIEINGGDTWTYSGSTSTPVSGIPNGIGTIGIINGTTGSSLTIQFTPTNATGYNVYQSTMPLNTFTIGTSTTEGTIEVQNLQNQTEYYFYVVGTNISGASAPSQIVSGLVYDTQFNYLKNNLQALQTRLKNNLPQFNDVLITDNLIFPAKLPLINIFPETDDEENMAIGLTGKMDKIYNIKIRIYDQYSNRQTSEALLKLTEYAGLVQAQLEAVKDYQPYWYVSDITSTEYGEATIEQKILKYIDINWTCKRRVTRYQ